MLQTDESPRALLICLQASQDGLGTRVGNRLGDGICLGVHNLAVLDTRKQRESG